MTSNACTPCGPCSPKRLAAELGISVSADRWAGCRRSWDPGGLRSVNKVSSDMETAMRLPSEHDLAGEFQFTKSAAEARTPGRLMFGA